MDHAPPIQNKLLAVLPREEYVRAVERMQRVTLPVGEVLCDPGRPIRFVHFPVTGVFSSVVAFENGAVVEAATIGNEGMAGLAALVDDRASPDRVVQRIEGDVLRLPADEFRALVETGSRFRSVVGRYSLALLQQYAQNAACNLHHDIGERMCRWLLTTADRIGRDDFRVTQEFLGEMLGVSRQSVNATAGLLQEAGLIAYRRGRLRVTDRPRLEAAACECYRVTKEAYDRLMRPAA
ncbi:MAG TPA: Crp/Fnr family transcriptional regulator [Planctomycetaceae bacterium]